MADTEDQTAGVTIKLVIARATVGGCAASGAVST
jgi:hypothetical protein